MNKKEAMSLARHIPREYPTIQSRGLSHVAGHHGTWVVECEDTTSGASFHFGNLDTWQSILEYYLKGQTK